MSIHLTEEATLIYKSIFIKILQIPASLFQSVKQVVADTMIT